MIIWEYLEALLVSNYWIRRGEAQEGYLKGERGNERGGG